MVRFVETNDVYVINQSASASASASAFHISFGPVYSMHLIRMSSFTLTFGGCEAPGKKIIGKPQICRGTIQILHKMLGILTKTIF